MDGGQAVRHQAGRHAGARRRARRSRAAAHRRRLLQQQEGADRRAEVLAVRDGPRPAGQPRQGPVRRPAGAARGARGAATRGRSSASRSTGPRSSASTRQLGLPPTVGATASRVAVPVYRGGRQVGQATTTTWSPVLKKMIALATVDRPHYAEGTQAADRGDGRSRPPPGGGDRGADAVLQPAAKDRRRRRPERSGLARFAALADRGVAGEQTSCESSRRRGCAPARAAPYVPASACSATIIRSKA